MKKIILILLILFQISCQFEDENVCSNRKINESYRIPFFFNNDKYYLFTSTEYPSITANEIPLSSLITYNIINDSITIKKVDIIGVPLVFHQNTDQKLFLITSKCFYSIDENNNLVFELEYNTQVGNQLIGKTIYDYKDDNIFIRPGIDNPNFEVFVINQNNLKSQILANMLTVNKQSLVDFSIPKAINNFEFVFTDGVSYYTLKDDNLITKKLSTQDRIYSISYNNVNNEICLGTTNGNIYYDDFSKVRVNSLYDGTDFPDFKCDDDIVTDLNFSNDIAYYSFNNDYAHLGVMNLVQKKELLGRIGSSKSNNWNKVVSSKCGNLKEYYGMCCTGFNNQKANIRLDSQIGSGFNSLNFWNIEFFFNQNNARINKKDTSFTKSFNY